MVDLSYAMTPQTQRGTWSEARASDLGKAGLHWMKSKMTHAQGDGESA